MPKTTAPIPHYITYVTLCGALPSIPEPDCQSIVSHRYPRPRIRSGTGRDLYIQNVYMKPVAPVTLQESLRDATATGGPVEIPHKRFVFAVVVVAFVPFGLFIGLFFILLSFSSIA